MSAPDTSAAADREQRILGIIETARAKRPRFKDEQVTMAHGAGGKATQTLIEGLLVPAFGSEALDELGDAGAVDGRRARAGDDDRQLRGQADPLPRRLDRRAGGQRDRQRPRGGGRAAARAQPVAGARGGAATRTSCGPRSRRSPPPPRRRGSRWSPATPRSSSAATPTGCTSAPPGSGASTPRAALSPAALEPGDRVLVSGPIGEHGTAIMLARGELELDAEIESDTRSLWPAADALLEAAGPALRCMRDATRGGVATVLNELARASRRRRSSCARPTCRCARRSRAPPRCSGSTRCTSPTRASSSPSSRPEAADAALAALRAVPGCEGAAEIGEVKTEPPGMVLVETAFGGRRVMDLLAGDPLPRIC